MRKIVAAAMGAAIIGMSLAACGGGGSVSACQAAFNSALSGTSGAQSGTAAANLIQFPPAACSGLSSQQIDNVAMAAIGTTSS